MILVTLPIKCPHRFFLYDSFVFSKVSVLEAPEDIFDVFGVFEDVGL